MFKGGWTRYREREFAPRRFGSQVRTNRTLRPQQKIGQLGGVYSEVQNDLRNVVPKSHGRWRAYQDVTYLGTMIDAALKEARASNEPRTWLRALALQAPHAAQAQRQMDKHPHGFKNKSVRTLELIDFNDTFVGCVLALPKEQQETFAVEGRQLMDWFCKRVGVPGFNTEQYDGIVRGLSREIAVYHGAIAQGLEARLTGREADALGIDVVVTDPATRRAINIDCKTPSAFRHRLGELVFEGRISEGELQQAMVDGYCAELNGHGEEQVKVVVLAIEQERYGNVEHFRFSNEQALGDTLRFLLSHFSV